MINVRVCIPQSVLKDQPFLGRFQGKVMKVKEMKTFHARHSFYYTLHGAESAHGISYCFMREWISPVMIRIE